MLERLDKLEKENIFLKEKLDKLKRQNIFLKKRVVRLEAKLENTPPVGTVIWFAANKIPQGYLRCDGRWLEKSKYPELANVLREIWGVKTGSKFRIPNLEGIFIRGYEEGGTRKLGEKQEWSTALPKDAKIIVSMGGEHRHKITIEKDEARGGGTKEEPEIHGADSEYHTTSAGKHDHKATFSGFKDKETRPVNQALVPCIKY